MTHGIAIDPATGVAINWFTLCGKHVIFLPPGDALDNTRIDCARCKEKQK